eukprot:GGOE01040718.1.p1 GENE.GGOE01040718.1~~GGOE01040718.1.p1  ORF type:complete len:977 (+),score=208.04 GGOE01040718.1:27-2957(+)
MLDWQQATWWLLVATLGHAIDLCTFHAHHKLNAPDTRVVEMIDDFGCCKFCAATPGCLASVQTGRHCHLKHLDRPFHELMLSPSQGSTVCVTLYVRQASGPGGAYPPLPKPNFLPNASYPAAVRLASGFPLISTEDPHKLGFPMVERSGSDAADLAKVCLESGQQTPIPTNDWWTPAIRPHNPATLTYIFAVPYMFNIHPGGAHVSYPFMMSSRSLVRNVVNRYWTITAEEAVDTKFCIHNYDELSASFQWRDGETSRAIMEMPIVRGSPYATMRYLEATPKVFVAQTLRSFHVDGTSQSCTGNVVHGHKFTLRFQDGDEEWQLYLPPKTHLTCRSGVEGGFLSTILTIQEKAFTGYLRIALANNCTTGEVPPSPHCHKEGVAHSHMHHYAEALDQGSNVCPLRGHVAMQATETTLDCTLEWEVTECWQPSFFESDILLLIALPHHMSRMDDSFIEVIPSGGHRNTRGYNTPVRTLYNKWVLRFLRTPIGWIETPDKHRIPAIRTSLIEHDAKLDLPADVQWGFIDPYNAGKELSRIARLVLIAEKLGEKDVLRDLSSKLTVYLSIWLDHRSANRLLYDKSWGGVVSCGCMYVWHEQEKKASCSNNAKELECPVLKDSNADFGNGHYNDHHFHYGYFLYAAAVAAHVDPSWGKSYYEKVLVLLRDIANPTPDDPYFPQFRHFDWYLGHSWASGIVTSPNGKNQESTSEAVNAHYGACLLGLATSNKPMAEMGELMMLLESHASKFYWYGSGGVFPPEYEHDMAGIVHDMLFEFQTFFGPQTYFVHGIHVLPLTGATKYLLSPDWLEVSLKAFDQSCAGDGFCHGSGFITFNYASHAFLDKDDAWEKVLSLPDKGPQNAFDFGSGGGNGNSKTNTLFWCASVGNDEEPPAADYFEDLPGPTLRRKQRHITRILGSLAFTGIALTTILALRKHHREVYNRYVVQLPSMALSHLEPLCTLVRTRCTERWSRLRGYDSVV